MLIADKYCREYKYPCIRIYKRYDGNYRIFSRNGTYLCDVNREHGKHFLWTHHARITPNQIRDISDFMAIWRTDAI